ncbi:uncharacterized protein VNE69_08120 [Vairimorpha necatrix]|uniref:Uncharacterized protein n=1 Tax=Vairimorpha necatrix TaxID=6039 RepID=A0AAX4JEE2_9MICR
MVLYIYIGLAEAQPISSYIITELVKKDLINGVINTYNKRSNSGKECKPYYFQPVTSASNPNLMNLIRSYDTNSNEEKKLMDCFSKSVIVLMATLPLNKDKTYYIDVMKTYDGLVVDTYSTSEKLMFDVSTKFYNLRWLNVYNPSTIHGPETIQKFYGVDLSKPEKFNVENEDHDLEVKTIRRGLQGMCKKAVCKVLKQVGGISLTRKILNNTEISVNFDFNPKDDKKINHSFSLDKNKTTESTTKVPESSCTSKDIGWNKKLMKSVLGNGEYQNFDEGYNPDMYPQPKNSTNNQVRK